MGRRLSIRGWVWWFAAAASLLPAPAYANTGTPMMWASMLHLTIGNFVIGLIEGALLARIYKRAKAQTTGLMVAANYVSAFVGILYLGFLNGRLYDLLVHKPLLQIPWFMLGSLVLAFALSVVVEWPFVHKAITNPEWSMPRLKGRSFRASLLIQTISYALLLVWYLLASPISLIAKLRVDPTVSFAASTKAWVYYISNDDGNVYRCRLDGSERSMQYTLYQPLQNSWLCVAKRPGLQTLDLAIAQGHTVHDYKQMLMHTSLPKSPAFTGKRGEYDLLPKYRALDLRKNKGPEDNIFTGFWAAEGLDVHTGDIRANYALETPLAQWKLRYATVLPGDIVVLQCRDFIAAISLREHKIGFVTYGHGPIALPDEYVGPMLPPKPIGRHPPK